MRYIHVTTVCEHAVQALVFVVIYICDDRVLTGDENVQRHRHLGGCTHHQRGAGWWHDSTINSSYHHLEVLVVDFACVL